MAVFSKSPRRAARVLLADVGDFITDGAGGTASDCTGKHIAICGCGKRCTGGCTDQSALAVIGQTSCKRRGNKGEKNKFTHVRLPRIRVVIDGQFSSF